MTTIERWIHRAALCGLVLLSLPASAQNESAGTLGGKETVLRVLQLSQELEKLLASLPPETQEALRAQLIDRLASPAGDPAVAHSLETEPIENPSSTGDTSSTGTSIAAQPAPKLAPTVRPGDGTEAGRDSDREAVIAAEPREPSTVEPGTIEPGTLEPDTAQPKEPSAPTPEAPPIEPPAVIEPPTVIASTGTESTRATDRQAPRVTPPPIPSTDEPGERPSRRQGCQTVVSFDTDGDGKLTGLDRYWRHFYLWTDVDEDRSVDAKEVESPYERGIREIDVGLRSFVRGKGKRKRSLEILLENYILLDVGGDGWSGDPRGDDGALAIDATAIREAGGPDVHDARGRRIEGIQPFQPGWRLLVDGDAIVANCPRG